MAILRTWGRKALYFLIYVTAIFVSFVFIGSAFVFVKETKLESIAVLVTAVVIGGITPLAAANYSIENWKKQRGRGANGEKLSLRQIISGFFELIVIFISMIVTAGFTAIIGLTAGDYIPILLQLPPVVLAFPALIAGVVTYIVLASIKDLVIERIR